MSGLAVITRDVTDEAGNLLDGAQVTIRVGHDAGGALAAIYADEAGGAAIANPVTLDGLSNGSPAAGQLQVYAEPGLYRLEGTGAAGVGFSLVDTTSLGWAGAIYDSRAEAIASSPSAVIVKIEIKTPNGDTLAYKRDATGTALTTADGSNWSPVGDATPDHFGDNTSPGTTDMTSAYQAALDYGAGGSVTGRPFSTYLVTAQLSLKSGTFWDHKNSKIIAGGVASSSFFSLWKPENGANRFKVLNQRLDGNNQAGMIGFLLGVGTHNFIVDNFVVENCPHNPPTIDGGRGFNVESLDTVLDNSNGIITNGVVRNCYMGFSMQSGDNFGNRHGIRISNIQVEDCDVVWWAIGQGSYPFVADKMQFDVSDITAKNCGLPVQYTNGGGAFGFDRACNITMRNIVLSNDAGYGSIPCVWHGNGANLQANITFNGDCGNFWNFQPYKEDNAPPAFENTIQDAILRAVHRGVCTDVATIGTASGTAALNVHIEGHHNSITSGRPTTNNLLQDDVWFDIFHKPDNARIQGNGFDIGAAAFASYPNVVRRYSQKDKQASFTRTATIADDAVGVFPIPDNMFAFTFAISTNSEVPCAGIFSGRSVATEFVRVLAQAVGTTASITFFAGSGVPTGTTFPDGRIGVTVSGGNIYIENRSGASYTFAVTVNPSV